MHIKIAHVEAGLHSFNMDMPEEINRILTDRISDILFCPTDIATQNLQKEGFDMIEARTVKCGDVMQDAAMFYGDKAKKIHTKVPERFILSTIHRAENTDDIENISQIIQALNEISKNTDIIMPLHPRTKKIIEKMALNSSI